MRTTFVTPVYTGDSAHVVESVKCLRRAEPTARIVIADDCFAPIDARSRAALDALKCDYIQTGYDRNGNLLGPANLIGQTALFARLGETCDVIVKFDADSMVIDTAWIHDFAENRPEAVIAGVVRRDNHHWIYGMCYAIRSSVLPALAADARRVLAHRDAFEDYEVSTRLFRLSFCREDYAARHVEGPRSGFVLTTLAGANESFANARVCNFGYDLQSTPPADRPAWKERQLAMMRRINEILEERQKTQ